MSVNFGRPLRLIDPFAQSMRKVALSYKLKDVYSQENLELIRDMRYQMQENSGLAIAGR